MASIAEIRLLGYEHVLEAGHAYGTVRGLNTRRNCAIVEVTLDNGTIGHGEAGGPPRALAAQLVILRSFFIGTRAVDFEITTTRAFAKLYHFGHQNMLVACASGMSVAVIDALGKTLGLAACDLLGGRAVDTIQGYATTGHFHDGGFAAFEQELAGVAGRFAAAKIKIGAGVRADVERVRKAREILGDGVVLMVDANCNYPVDLALQSMRAIEAFDIHWYEEPLPPADIQGYAELHARAPISLAAGEAHYTAHDFRRLIEARCIDIVQPSLIVSGGLGQCRQICSLAQMHNLRVSPSAWGGGLSIAAGLHLMASLPQWPHTDHVPVPFMIEFDTAPNDLREVLVPAIAPAHGGMIAVPVGPGLGVVPDLEAVAMHSITY